MNISSARLGASGTRAAAAAAGDALYHDQVINADLTVCYECHFRVSVQVSRVTFLEGGYSFQVSVVKIFEKQSSSKLNKK